MEASRELRERMRIHIKHMIEQYLGHEFDHLAGRCRCGATIGLRRCVRLYLTTQPSQILFDGEIGAWWILRQSILQRS